MIVSRVPFLYLRDLVGYGMGKRGINLSLGAGIPNQLLEIAVFLGTQLTILGIEEYPVREHKKNIQSALKLIAINWETMGHTFIAP